MRGVGEDGREEEGREVAAALGNQQCLSLVHTDVETSRSFRFVPAGN